jgi:hypothetical protein
MTLIVVVVGVVGVGLVCGALTRPAHVVLDVVPVVVNAVMMLAMLFGPIESLGAAGLGLVCFLICGRTREWDPGRAHRAITTMALIPLLLVHASTVAKAELEPGSMMMGGSSSGTGVVLLIGTVIIYSVLSMTCVAWLVKRAPDKRASIAGRHQLAELGELVSAVVCVLLMV